MRILWKCVFISSPHSYLETFCKAPSTNIMEDREEFVEGSRGDAASGNMGGEAGQVDRSARGG